VPENSGSLSDTSALLTDTLPSEVDFGTWIEQPAGASESSDEITWSGAVTTSAAITFTFIANHVGDYSDVVTNTAEYSGTWTLVGRRSLTEPKLAAVRRPCRTKGTLLERLFAEGAKNNRLVGLNGLAIKA